MQQESCRFVESPGEAVGRRARGAWQRIRTLLIAVDRTLAEWHFRAESRKELARLDRHVLRDVGLDPMEVHREAHKPFWRE